MAVRKRLTAFLAVAAWLVFAGVAGAAFPNYDGCNTGATGFQACIDIQSVSGNIAIKDFVMPLGDSLEIRGAIAADATGSPVFVPARGTNGFFAEPVRVPGGLLGIEWLPGNTVLAITELAGGPSDIRIAPGTFDVSLPVKVRLVNVFIGMNCHIGSNSNPIRLNLTARVGGELRAEPGQLLSFGTVLGDDSFAVPSASSCGLGLGLINSLVNLRLGLPSSSGNNSIEITNNIGLKLF